MQWRKYILLAVPFLLSAIFILFAVPVQYRFFILHSCVSFLDSLLYIIVPGKEEEKMTSPWGRCKCNAPFLTALHIMIEKHSW